MDGTLLAVVIFGLRVVNYAVGTFRLVAITRNLRLIAAILAALEALIFAVVIANIVSDLENVVNLIAYCAGAAVGSWVGMMMESRFIKGYAIINVFINQSGREIATFLRDSGYGVTEIVGEGRDGEVLTLRSVINKREVKKFTKLVQEKNPNAFLVTEEVRGIRHGYMGTGRGKTM